MNTRHTLHVPCRAPRARQRGLSLIELMIAMVLGVLVVAAVLQIFSANSASARTQYGVARIQEATRVISAIVGADLRQATYRHCASSIQGLGGHLRQTVLVLSKDKVPGFENAFVESGQAYGLSTSAFLQGYECGDGACSPALPSHFANNGSVPNVGTAAGNRVPNSDVLAVRYIGGRGVPLASSMNMSADDVALNLSDSGWAPIEAGDELFIGDCEGGEIFTATGVSSGVVAHDKTRNFRATLSAAYATNGFARAYRIPEDVVERVYYLGYRADPNDASRLTSSLFVLQNGRAEALVDGVERMDITFDRSDDTGAISTMTAAAVATAGAAAATELNGVRIALLLNSVDNANLVPASYRYDGETVTAPDGDLRLRQDAVIFINLRNRGVNS